MPTMDRLRIDERHDDVGMTSVSLWVQGYGDAPNAQGYAPSAEIGFYIENPIGLLPESHANEQAGDALIALLDSYSGINYDASGIYPGVHYRESIDVSFGLDYLEGEDTDALVERIDQTTDFNRLYNEAGIFLTFTEKLFEAVGLTWADVEKALHPSEVLVVATPV
jgi:hypothetical protein